MGKIHSSSSSLSYSACSLGYVVWRQKMLSSVGWSRVSMLKKELRRPRGRTFFIASLIPAVFQLLAIIFLPDVVVKQFCKFKTQLASVESKSLTSISSQLFPLPSHLVACKLYYSVNFLFMKVFTLLLTVKSTITHNLRLTLVFMWNSAQREKFSFCFSRVFCQY